MARIFNLNTGRYDDTTKSVAAVVSEYEECDFTVDYNGANIIVSNGVAAFEIFRD
jgi:hypothetical protein